MRKEKRNIFKLNLTQVESKAANEQNTANGQQSKELGCNKLDLLGVNTSDTFQTIQKDPSDCDNLEKDRISDVKDKREEFSSPKVELDSSSDAEGPSLDIKGAEEVEKMGDVKPTAKPRNLSLKVDYIVLEKGMEGEYIPEAAQEVSAEEFDQAETEIAQKDNSTLNDKVAARENDNDFDLSKVSNLNQDLDYQNVGRSTLNDQKSSLSTAAAIAIKVEEDHSALNHELDAKSTVADVEGSNRNTSDQSKTELDAATDDSSTLNDQMSGRDSSKGEMCHLNQSDSQLLGCEDDLSTLNDGIQQITTTTKELEVDMAIVSSSNQPESVLEAAGDGHSTLNDQSHANPPGSSYKDDNTTLNHTNQPVLTTVKEHESHVSEVPGPNKSESHQEAAKDDNSTLTAKASSSSIDQISSESLRESEQGDGRSQANEQNVEQPVIKPTGTTETESKMDNDVSETTAVNHPSSEATGTLATPSLVLATPFIVVDTSFIEVVTPPPQDVSKNVDSKGTASETDNEKSAPVNQKTTPPTTNPAPAVTTTPVSDQATPTISQTTPTCIQITPPTSQTTPPSLNTTPPCGQISLPEDTPLSEQTTPPPLAQSRVARLRGYLMKRGGALKAWKQRWFVFAEERNALVYFRTPRDLTPLGQVCLSHASFTCEEAEPGVFYLHTPERTVTLKAQSDELKFYWLQQLQLRRWIHRPHAAPSDTADTAGAELFPQLECVEEVNTEETTSQPLLLQLSLKHPFIELQNSVQILRRRSSNDCGQSVFHVPTPTLTSPTTLSTNPCAGLTVANQETGQDSRSANRKSSPGLIQVTPPSSQTPPTASLTPPTVPQTTPTAGQVTLRRKTRSILRRSASSWSERSRLQQQLQDQKDLVVVLQKALELCQSERRSWRLDQPDLNQPSIDEEDFSQSTEGLEDLRRRLDQTQAEVEELKTSLNQKDQTIQDLKKEVRELSERNQAKQQVIEKLSSCVSQWAEQSADVDQGSIQSLVQQNLNLQDDLKAFRKQNHFLNSEIHHLSGLWRTSTESQRVLMGKVSVQRGQYLRVLRELQEVSLRDEAQSEALKNIIQDALSQEQSQLQAQVHRDQDQYGFQLAQDFEVDDIKLLIKLQAPDLKSTQSQDAVERPLVARWDQFMSSCRGELNPSPELKSLIRTGVPPHLRPQVWNWIIRTRTQRDKDPQQYQQLCEQMESSPQSGSKPWSRQIDLDLPRTLCTNNNFSSPSSPALQQLRRILLAFSWENPSIGYCQGLNRIAGLLLLVLGSEEDTFWALKAVVENIMPPKYYSPSLVGSQADQLVLKDFLAEKLPRLSSHLDRCGVDLSASTFAWFLVVFVEVLPSHILLPLWDAFMYEGSKVLFRFTLALFKLKEPEILQLTTPLELYQYFRVLPKTVSDYRRLSTVAFDELNPFSRRAVRSRRALHLERLQRELSDLRQQQTLFLSQRSIRRSTEEESAGGDQEEALDNNSEEELFE